MTQLVIPQGKKISVDTQGHAIYQVHANGIEIGYKLIGNGEPLLMIMGLGNTMERWPQAFISKLSEKYQLILFDNRGMGYTKTNNEAFSCSLFAEDVIGLLDALQIQSINIFGISMGSAITQELLANHPQRINKAILCGSAINGEEVIAKITEKAPQNPIIRQQIEATKKWKISLDKLTQLTNQVLVIIGTADVLVGTKASIDLASTIPGAWLIQFPNATHYIVDEIPIELAEITSLFLDINSSKQKNIKPLEK